MIDQLLAQHTSEDVVAFGAAGERAVRDLLRDVAHVARSLPDATPGSHVLVAVRSDRYAFAVAMLASWSRGHALALAPIGVRRELFLQLATRSEVAAVLHDTFSSAPLRIDRLLSEPKQLTAAEFGARAEHDLGVSFYAEQAGELSARHVRRSELLAEAERLAQGLALPERARALVSVSPETRFGLVAGVLWPLLRGGAFLREALAPGSACAGDLLITVPAQLRELLRGLAFPQLRAVVCATAPLVQPTAALLRQRSSAKLHDVYVSAHAGCVGARSGVSSDFQALPGAELVLDLPNWPAQLEEELAWLPGVEDAAVLALPDPSRVYVALLAPNGDEAALHARVAASALHGAQLAEVRVCRRPPRGLQRAADGCHVRARLLRFFDLGPDARPLAFEIALVSSDTEQHTYQMHVPGNYVYFAGHFPGYPILPGAAQLSEMVLPCVRRARPGLGRLLRMARLKFQERIKPDELIDVSLAFAQDPGQVDFTLRRGATLCAAGRLVFAAEGA